MSIHAISWASRQKLPPRDKFVLVALCDHYNKDEQRAWMKQETLAEWTGYTRVTVNAALDALEHKHKLIRSETRRYKDGRNAAKVYRLNFSVKEIDSGESRVNEVYTDKVNAVDTDRVKEIDNKNLEHRTVNQEPKKKRENKAHAFNPETVDLPPNFDREHFIEFCAARLRNDKPMTERALSIFLKKHGRHDKSTLDAMFEDAAIGEWQDLYYPPKGRDEPQLARKGDSGSRAAQQATNLLAHLERRAS